MSVIIAIVLYLVLVTLVTLFYGAIIFLVFNTMGLGQALGLGELPFLACAGIGLLLTLLSSRVLLKRRTREF